MVVTVFASPHVDLKVFAQIIKSEPKIASLSIGAIFKNMTKHRIDASVLFLTYQGVYLMKKLLVNFVLWRC